MPHLCSSLVCSIWGKCQMNSTTSALCTLPSVHCPPRPPVFWSHAAISWAHLLVCTLSPGPKHRHRQEVTFHPADASIFIGEAVLYLSAFSYLLLLWSHRMTTSSLWTEQPAVSAFSDVDTTTAEGGLNTSTSWPNNLLGKPLSLHTSFRSPMATSSSCILLAVTLQLHNSTQKTFQIEKALNTVHFAAAFSTICTVLFLFLAEDHFLYRVHMHIWLACSLVSYSMLTWLCKLLFSMSIFIFMLVL